MASFDCELLGLMVLPWVINMLDYCCTALFCLETPECFLALGDWDRKPAGFMN